MPSLDKSKVNLALPEQPIDKAVSAPSYDMVGVVTNPSADDVIFNAPSATSYLPVGIFSFDDTIYYDLGNSSGFSTVNGNNVGPDVSGRIRSFPDGTIGVQPSRRVTVSPYDVNVRSVLLAKQNQGISGTDSSGAGLAYDPRENYQKIILEGTATDNTPVSHNLDYIPFFRAWVDDGTAIIPAYPNDCYLTTTIIVFDNSSGWVSLYWRLYYES